MAVKVFTQAAVVTATSQSAGIWLDSAAIENEDQASPQYTSVTLVATAVSGTTPSLTAEIQWSNDGVNWGSAQPADTLTAITAAGNTSKSFLCKGAYARLSYVVTGTTPSFTLTASAYTA